MTPEVLNIREKGKSVFDLSDGPHFDKGLAQEKLRDDRKSKEDWNPCEPMRLTALYGI